MKNVLIDRKMFSEYSYKNKFLGNPVITVKLASNQESFTALSTVSKLHTVNCNLKQSAIWETFRPF